MDCTKKPGDLVRRQRELADSSRNERQKAILLAEVAKIRDRRAGALREEAARLHGASKKACERAAGKLTLPPARRHK